VTVVVSHVYTAENITVASPTIAVTDTPASGDVLVLVTGNGGAVPITAVSGCGATWSKVTGFTSASNIVEAWVGTGATTSGTISTTTASTAPRTLEVLMVSGLSSNATGVTVSGSGTRTTPAQTAGLGQLVIGAGWSDTSADSLTTLTPSTGWTVNRLAHNGSTLFTGVGYRIPTASASHSTAANRSGGNTTFVSQLVLGDAGATYNMDWSENSVGPTINYGSGVKFRLDDSVPAGANKSVGWRPVANGTAVGFSLPLTLGAAGTVSFYRRTSSEAGYDFLKFYIDGVVPSGGQWSGETAWGQVSFALAAGSHTLKWEYSKDGSGTSGSDTAWVALLSVTNVTSPPPAVSSTKTAKTYDFEDGAIPGIVSTSTWTNSTNAPISGTRSLRTPAVTAGNGVYNADIAVPSLPENGAVTFALKRDAEPFDQASVLVDGTPDWISLTSASTDSRSFRYIVPASNTSTITVRYAKDGSVNGGADAVWLDNIAIPYQITAAGGGGTINSGFTGSGSLSTTLTNYRKISSGFSGAGTLASLLTNYRRINSSFSGAGVLDTAWKDYRNLYPAFTGDGSLTTSVAKSVTLISSSFSGQGTLSTALTNYRELSPTFSGLGVLSTGLAYTKRINSAFSGAGTLTTARAAAGVVIQSKFYGVGYLQTVLEYSPRFSTEYSGEGVLFTELGYVVTPRALDASPLGKLASFSINTAAVPTNPVDGSGSAPSVNAGYTKGTDPEYALGETNVLKNGAIGTYEGEIVKVGTSQASGVARISMDTALTPLNIDKHLFPFIDAVAGLWTAARAIDYWTQQCGLFYDKVPGKPVAYASGFGHTDAYGTDTTARFYEKLTGGTTATQVVNGRSVKTLGSAVTGTTALHELPKGSVPVTLPKNKKLVFSIGLGLLGTGRTSTVEWSFLDAKDVRHTVALSATSAGAVTAMIGSDVVASASVPAGATYRLAFSLERLSPTALVGKLTVHTDDLAGTGDLVHTGNAAVISKALPSILRLTGFEHRSAGGSGAQMIRWGTYLTVAARHPMELPAVQKVLGETKKVFGFVSGFTGNVWNLLNEFCSIARLEVRFIDGALRIEKRNNTLSNQGGSWARFEVDRERREKYKQVAVVNKQSKAVSTNDAVLWRADSVFSVAAREVFETTVQTGHSILSLVQPVPVSGIMPFPYKQGGGQYVVTGADGYIIAPAWWNDNGGKVEVSLTGEEGEIAVKITAPTLDTVRAPYRISEGEADRPALYVCGSGILNDPKEVHVATGAKNAREGFDNVFESPFIAGVRETYDTAAAMAHQYSASVADAQYELPNSFETPTGLGQFPAGALVTDGRRNYRIQDASQTHSKVSGSAVSHTTIGAYVASYPAGSTIKDEKARNFGRTIRKFNIKPLKGDA